LNASDDWLKLSCQAKCNQGTAIAGVLAMASDEPSTKEVALDDQVQPKSLGPYETVFALVCPDTFSKYKHINII